MVICKYFTILYRALSFHRFWCSWWVLEPVPSRYRGNPLYKLNLVSRELSCSIGVLTCPFPSLEKKGKTWEEATHRGFCWRWNLLCWLFVHTTLIECFPIHVPPPIWSFQKEILWMLPNLTLKAHYEPFCSIPLANHQHDLDKEKKNHCLVGPKLQMSFTIVF